MTLLLFPYFYPTVRFVTPKLHSSVALPSVEPSVEPPIVKPDDDVPEPAPFPLAVLKSVFSAQDVPFHNSVFPNPAPPLNVPPEHTAEVEVPNSPAGSVFA